MVELQLGKLKVKFRKKIPETRFCFKYGLEPAKKFSSDSEKKFRNALYDLKWNWA